MTTRILLSLLLLAGACRSPERLMQTGDYDAAIRRHSRHLNQRSRVQGLELALRAAQTRDRQRIDSLLALEPANWPVVHTVYRGIQNRQQRLAARQPIVASDGYTPQLDWVGNVDSLEKTSREHAADYLYAAALPLLEAGRQGDKIAAREAFQLFQRLSKDYFPEWRDAASLSREARQAGITHILVSVDGPFLFNRAQIERDMHLDWYLNDGGWQAYHTEADSRVVYDYQLDLEFVQLDPGMEMRSENTRSQEKDIQVGEKVERDSSGKVIDRTPIYERISGSITETRITRDAQANVWITLSDLHSGQRLKTEAVWISERFDETWVSTSGDTRALDHVPICTGIGFPSAPSDWEMISRLAASTRSRLLNWLDWNVEHL